MRFYKQPHAFYAGIDLHARSMFTHSPTWVRQNFLAVLSG
jgi:hypothetical protein